MQTTLNKFMRIFNVKLILLFQLLQSSLLRRCFVQKFLKVTESHSISSPFHRLCPRKTPWHTRKDDIAYWLGSSRASQIILISSLIALVILAQPISPRKSTCFACCNFSAEQSMSLSDSWETTGGNLSQIRWRSSSREALGFSDFFRIAISQSRSFGNFPGHLKTC